MTLEIKNITSEHLYCSLQSNIVPQIGSIVDIDGHTGTILKVESVTYHLYPSSHEVSCTVWVKQHIGKVIILERNDSLRPLIK